MTQNVRFGLIAIGVLLVVWLMGQMAELKDANSQREAKLVSLQEQASHYASLKKRWDKKGEKAKVLQKLSRLKAFDKRFSKGGHEVIVYKKLKAKMLDRITYALFASDLMLVDVSLIKEEEGVTLKVEMK